MATKQNKNALVRCEHCGEWYSVTYKECPFCDDYDMERSREETSTPSRSGGKRLVTNKKGGGYGNGWTRGRIILTAVSIGIIIAAFLIVLSIIKPLIDRGQISDPSISPSSSISPSPSQTSPSPSDAVEPSPSDEPSAEPSPTIPAGQTATGFTISETDFSFSDRYPTPITLEVTFSPAGSTGTITWTSSDPDVATVDANGKVSPGGKSGTATITASMTGAPDQTCTVRSTVTSAPSPSQSTSVSFTLNKSDFTLSRRGETYQIKVNGSSSAPTWSSSNTSVATVASNGTVTAVGNGTCTVTATIGGTSQKCIVRVSY